MLVSQNYSWTWAKKKKKKLFTKHTQVFRHVSAAQDQKKSEYSSTYSKKKDLHSSSALSLFHLAG